MSLHAARRQAIQYQSSECRWRTAWFPMTLWSSACLTRLAPQGAHIPSQYVSLQEPALLGNLEVLKHLERLFWVGRCSVIGCNCLSMPVARPLHLRCQSLLLHHLFQFVGPETSSRSFQVSASKKLKKIGCTCCIWLMKQKSALLLLHRRMIQGQHLQHLQERKRLIQVTGVWCWPAGPGHPCQLSAWASRGICVWMYTTSKPATKTRAAMEKQIQPRHLFLGWPLNSSIALPSKIKCLKSYLCISKWEDLWSATQL